MMRRRAALCGVGGSPLERLPLPLWLRVPRAGGFSGVLSAADVPSSSCRPERPARSERPFTLFSSTVTPSQPSQSESESVSGLR